MIEDLQNEIKENLKDCYNLTALKMVNSILKSCKEQREKEKKRPYTIEDASQLLEVPTVKVMELVDNGTLKADKDYNIEAEGFRAYMNEYFGYTD